MALQLVEGQDFGAHYSLLHRITESNSSENWLALDKELNERVLIKVFKAPLDDTALSEISASIAALKGLIHPHIARLYELDKHEALDFISSQYIKGAEPWRPSHQFSDEWLTLRQALDALEFAHGLSISHGHLHPGNLLIDESGKLFITDFGLPPVQEHEFRDYLSSQIRAGQRPDPSDDIYSLGCQLFRALTGRHWRSGETFQSDSPIKRELQDLVIRMLHESPYDRPKQISQIRRVIEDTVSREDPSASLEVEPAGFSRRPDEPVSPSTGTTHRLPRERLVMSASTAFLGFALLILLVAAVFFLLPEQKVDPAAIPSSAPSPQTSAPAPPQANQAEPELAPFEIARLERLKEEGKEAANELVREQVRLEDLGVQIWAPGEYKEAGRLAAEGDNLYRDGEYEKALDVYMEAITSLKSLHKRRETIRQENVERGEKALESGDFQAAIEAYTVLSVMEPENQTWDRRLARAENLEKVLDHMRQGRNLEKQDALQDALAQFERAASLDGAWAPASEAIGRVRDKIAREKFTDAMSEAFTALADKRYEQARQAFKRAQQIFPNSAEPADGLQQVDLAERLDRIEAHQEVATRFESAEQWQAAIDEYRKALAIDDTLEFAQQGLERAKRRLDINERLDRFLSEPTVMQDDEELAKARRTIADAGRIESPGPKLQQKVADLSEYVSLARVPVNLEINSDNETDVTVYKVGNLGKIESTELELMPGKYTIVGERQGYRDVQEVVTLLAGQPARSVYISCTEKI